MKLENFTNDQLVNCATRLLVELKAREVSCGPMLRDALLTPSQKEQELVKTGKFIEAIKHHRTRTGAGLKESKDVMDAFRALIGQTSYASTPVSTTIRLTPRDHQRIQDGEYLEVIKDIRTRTMASFPEAKWLVDQYRLTSHSTGSAW